MNSYTIVVTNGLVAMCSTFCNPLAYVCMFSNVKHIFLQDIEFVEISGLTMDNLESSGRSGRINENINANWGEIENTEECTENMTARCDDMDTTDSSHTEDQGAEGEKVVDSEKIVKNDR
ncbi:hypothetical protein JTB14_013303 [Gonioctena quinquepunctata]|nr:hypothetical protein JTB14_013303 [Gonioctena quinquepunctata]